MANQLANHVGIVVAVGAGNADAYRLGAYVAVRQHVVDQTAEDALDLELTDRAEVRSASPGLGDHLAAFVGELTHRLCSSGIDA
jgi:hypothetical protein